MTALAPPSYGAHEKKLRFAMKIGGDHRVWPWRNSWPAAAKELGLDAERAAQRVADLAARAPDAFSDAAAAPEVAELERPLPARLVDLVTSRVGRCLAVLRE